MKSKKKDKLIEECYTITLKGLLALEFGEPVANNACNVIELHLRRHGLNAIILEDNSLLFKVAELSYETN